MAATSTSTRTSAAPGSQSSSRTLKPEPNMEDDAPPTVRRSGRVRRPPPASLTEKGDDQDDIQTSPSFQKSVQKSAANEARRNPKRKAAPEVFDLPDDLLDKALAPMLPDELDEWEAWVELESDPSFFNVILQDLGVKNVKMQELFSVDEGSLSILPKPVHGLIFLYQYVEEDAQETAENGDQVWFANQTTDNACATLALFNIIMNARDIELGDRLKAFKEASAPLLPPLRGDLLCNTTWIRKVHNQFARRLDLLNADLVLAHEAKAAKARKARPAKRAKTKPSTDAAFHFIAYVPVGDEVYQLDGLEKAPVCIGKVDSDGDNNTSDWTAVARPFIESRMLQYESEQLSFNLLALCRSPLHSLSDELARNITELAQVRRAAHRTDPTRGGPAPFPDGVVVSGGDNDDDNNDDDDDTIRFADFGLPATLRFDASARHALETQPLEAGGAALVQKLEARRSELRTERARLRAEYRAELSSGDDDARRAKGRKKDYTPFIHQWVLRLAQLGALQQIAEEVAMQQA